MGLHPPSARVRRQPLRFAPPDAAARAATSKLTRMLGTVSIVIPVRDDATPLERLLSSLRALEGPRAQIVVVDGGSSDRTKDVAAKFADVVIESAPGRGRQLRAGVDAAGGQMIWLLHADAEVDVASWRALLSSMRRAASWGRFDVHLTSDGFWFRVIERMMNARSRLTGICTGDQGIFVTRALLAQVGGVPDQPLMEDIELSKRLKRIVRPTCLVTSLGASARRWEANGVWRTVLQMWSMRIRYFFGESPESLARRYYG